MTRFHANPTGGLGRQTSKFPRVLATGPHFCLCCLPIACNLPVNMTLKLRRTSCAVDRLLSYDYNVARHRVLL